MLLEDCLSDSEGVLIRVFPISYPRTPDASIVRLTTLEHSEPSKLLERSLDPKSQKVGYRSLSPESSNRLESKLCSAGYRSTVASEKPSYNKLASTWPCASRAYAKGNFRRKLFWCLWFCRGQANATVDGDATDEDATPTQAPHATFGFRVKASREYP